MSSFPPLHGQEGAGSGIMPFVPYGIWGDSNSNFGVVGTSNDGVGIFAGSMDSWGLWAESIEDAGIAALSTNAAGIYSVSVNHTGIVGYSWLAGSVGIEESTEGGIGVYGENTLALGIGVRGHALDGVGVSGQADSGIGVEGSSASGIGLWGGSFDGYGVSGEAGDVGVYAHNYHSGNDAYLGAGSFAGDFHGDVSVLGKLYKPGGGFRIDHPLDAARKYLSHSFVESSDMKNIYDGVAVFDASGEVVVELPPWFDTLNTDFRYQLTCIGSYAPVYIAQEVQGNRFTIAGGTPGLKVSWQVTGIRQDPWAKAHRIPVEEEKPAEEQGYYLHPELYGEPDERHIRHVHYPK